MLGWIFKKDDTSASAAAAPAVPPEPAAASNIDWPQKLQAAQGSDDALLALARERAPVDVKLAAVGALASEASLKSAEREFRDHDRRVHRLAKQRLQAQVAQRETRERAAQLIEAAQALQREALIPTNRLVELDHAWQALDAALLEADQREAFGTALALLASLTRERGDEVLKQVRWAAEAHETLNALIVACTACAEGSLPREHLAAPTAAVSAALEAASSTDEGAALREALRRALDAGTALAERLVVLDELLQAPPGSEADARWQRLAPLPDADLHATLQRRAGQWRQSHEDARQASRAQKREQAVDTRRANAHAHTETLAAALERAETALAAGQLAHTNAQLVEIDELLQGHAPPVALRARIEALQAEYARLKGWQHWGGGVARDDLVLQAEALAAATRGEAQLPVAKLTTKQQAEVIADLRARWKELDRLGGATSRSLWQRFDGALHAAYLPVAEHFTAQRAAREQNLQARRDLVERLNAVALSEAEALPDWKSIAHALEGFQAEWRKLGPLEHTVPRKAQDTLLAQMNVAIERLDTPLRKVRQASQRTREQLVARARALTTEPSRDTVIRVRELQAEWQHHAKALPLARAAENALWSEFKGAIDAVFSAREAAFSARDAEFKAHGAARAALIERLAALNAESPAAELKRTLAEVETQWHQAGPAPRNDAAALDARFRSALDVARQWLATHDQRSWQASCDALLAKLALHEEWERSADKAAAKEEFVRQSSGLPALPAAWERALAQRTLTPARNTPPAELLLQLEAAWQLESPEAHQAARRDLKLHALKAALEGRGAKPMVPTTPDQWLCAAIACVDFDEAQRERFKAAIAALRERRSSKA